MEEKTKKIIIGFAVGIPLVILLISIIIWPLFARVREGGYHKALNSRIYFLEKKAARELRNYPSDETIFALIRFLNRVSLKSFQGVEAAKEALYSLCRITAQDFGTDYAPHRPQEMWTPPQSLEEWKATITVVNMWATAKFGAKEVKRQGAPVVPGYEKWYRETHNGKPPPTEKGPPGGIAGWRGEKWSRPTPLDNYNRDYSSPSCPTCGSKPWESKLPPPNSKEEEALPQYVPEVRGAKEPPEEENYWRDYEDYEYDNYNHPPYPPEDYYYGPDGQWHPRDNESDYYESP